MDGIINILSSSKFWLDWTFFDYPILIFKPATPVISVDHDKTSFKKTIQTDLGINNANIIKKISTI